MKIKATRPKLAEGLRSKLHKHSVSGMTIYRAHSRDPLNLLNNSRHSSGILAYFQFAHRASRSPNINKRYIPNTYRHSAHFQTFGTTELPISRLSARFNISYGGSRKRIVTACTMTTCTETYCDCTIVFGQFRLVSTTSRRCLGIQLGHACPGFIPRADSYSAEPQWLKNEKLNCRYTFEMLSSGATAY